MELFSQPAVKEKLYARVAIDGPTGSGKTWTGLQWARILAGPKGKIGVVDTENRSASYYAPDPRKPIERLNWWDPPYEFFPHNALPPYDPGKLADLIKAAGPELMETADRPAGVLLIDSLTHYWNGEGGTLDVVDNAAARYGGNTFAGWKEGTPVQRHLLDTIIHAPFHVVVTMRSKMEWIIEEVNGRKSPKKIGLAPEQRAGIEYEFTVVADMDLEHVMVVSKSRCDLIADRVAHKGRSAEVATEFADWLATGVERLSNDEVAELVAAMDRVTNAEDRKTIKQEFLAEFGRPTEMATDHLEAARAWLDGKVPPPLRQEGALADAVAEALPDQPEFDVDPEPES